MPKTVVIQIGNTDDKLSQTQWSHFVKALMYEVDEFHTQVHFFGFSEPTAPWQNCCVVFEVNQDYLNKYRHGDMEEYLEQLRMVLSDLARKYRQDSIALLVGETEFVSSKPTKENSAYSNQDREVGGEEDHGDRQEGRGHGEEGSSQEDHAGQEGGGQEDDDTQDFDFQGVLAGEEGPVAPRVEGGRSIYP